MNQEEIRVLIKSSRPKFWIIAPLVFLFGFQFAGGDFIPSLIIHLLLLTFPLGLILYGINDVYDYETDKKNKRKSKALPKKYHPIILKFSYVSIFLLVIHAIFTMNSQTMLSTSLLVLFAYYYSVPPIRFKEKPLLDSLSNGAIFFTCFAAGASYIIPIQEIPLKIYMVALVVAAIHAYAAIVDYKADKAAKVKTIATVFGKRTAAVFATACGIIAYLFSDIQAWIIPSYFLYCTALFACSIITTDEKVAYWNAKLIFVGFLITGLVFLF